MQYDSCPYKKRLEHRQAQRQDGVYTPKRGASRGTSLRHTWISDSQPPGLNCEKWTLLKHPQSVSFVTATLAN